MTRYHLIQALDARARHAEGDNLTEWKSKVDFLLGVALAVLVSAVILLLA